MAISEREVKRAETRMQAQRESGYVVAARYDRRNARVIVSLSTGVELAIPVGLVEGLADATHADLADIEISPAGLGLHWPRLDADVYVPALLQGILGTKSWMARQLGSTGGKSRSAAKAAASRTNGRKGGRPPKTANG